MRNFLKSFGRQFIIFFTVIATFGVIYAAWDDVVTSGDSVSSSSWNTLVGKVRDLDNVIKTDSGNAGIGTSSPSHNLHVVGTNPGFMLEHTGGVHGWMQVTAGIMDVGTANNYPMRLITGNTERLRIDTSGNVGIGTTNPNNLLEVSGRIRGNSFGIGTNTQSYLAEIHGVAGDSGLRVRSSDATSTILSLQDTNGTSRMVVSGDGNVGIGTTSPDGRLHVSSAIYSGLNGGNNGAFRAFDNSGVQQVNIDTHGYSYLNGGSFGIGTSTPEELLEVNGNIQIRGGRELKLKTSSGNTRGHIQASEVDDEHFIIATSGNEDIAFKDGGTAGDTNLIIYGDGNAWLRGSLTQNSDVRLKTNIQAIENPLELVQGIRGTQYSMKGQPELGKKYGFIAQEIESIFPELVRTANDDMGTKSVDYISLIPILVESIKSQQKQIDDQNAIIQTLQEKLMFLEGQ